MVLCSALQPAFGLPLLGEEAERFLLSAEVVQMRPLEVGITRPQQVTLRDGQHTLKAAWKTVDEFRRGITEFERGPSEVNFRDSYKYEIAAYELDKLLGLELVPPTVDREINGQRGALVLWVEGAMTEHDRRERKLQPKDSKRWSQQLYKLRLLHQLTYNTDFRNMRNLLIDPEFRIYAIDHTRAFRVRDSLLAEQTLARFSRSVLERLRRLDEPTLKEKLGDLLSGFEIGSLLKRRDRIVERAEQLVRERGESAVLYP
jgi:hypothetical protein